MNEKLSKGSGPPQVAELRRKAEARLLAAEGRPAGPRADADARALVHELQVHQIELEMQNEELQRTQAAAEEASEKYGDLFDFAPVGYFLWDQEGRILEVNLAGAALLGLDRSVAIEKRFVQFVAMENRAAFADFCKRVLTTDAKQTCQLKLVKDGQAVNVLVEGIAAQDRQGRGRLCRAAVIDMTQQNRADALAATNQVLQAEIAARKQADETLRQAKEEWEQTFNTVPDFVAILDDQYRIVRVNRPMAERLGVAPEQCVGLRCYEAVHGTAQPPDFCPHAQTCRDSREHTAEVHEPRLGGHFVISTTPRFDEQGRLIGTVHVARDITARKRDEDERETAAGFLRLVNESRGKEDLVRAAVTFFQQQSGCEAVGIRLKDGDDYPYYEARGFPQEFVQLENRLCAEDDAGRPIRDTAGNPVIECMCGNVIRGRFDPSKPFFTARGSFWTNCTTELLASTTEAERRAPTRNRCNGQGYESVALIALSVGEGRLGLLQLNDRRKSRFTAEGIALWERLAGYLAVALAKTLAEEGLARSAAIVESSDDAILSKDRDGIIQTWNAGAERLFGYRAEEAIGQPITLLVPPERVLEEDQIVGRVLSGQDVEHLETVRVAKDGRRIDVSVTVSPLKGQDGQVIGASKIVRDITERKRAEEALVHAEAAAEAANVAKSQFLASMSHELRTPMNAILGMTDLALGEQLPATVRDYLQTAKDSADLLLELLNEILDFSRIEAGRFELESAPFRLRKTVEQVVKTLGVRAYEKGLELACQVADEVPDAVVGDPLRVRQVLMNLVNNAVKFTPKGEVVLRVGLGSSVLGLGSSDTIPSPQSPRSNPQDLRPKTQDPRPVCTIHFSISDTGIGIAAEKLEKIFAPFTQADSSTSRRFGGTGLGLAISERLVNLMGGHIQVESELGEGSTFHFTLTLPVAERADDDREATAGDENVFRGLSALVIGESATSRKILQQTLASWLMKADEVPDVARGLTKIHEAAAAGRAYRVVLADAVMPEIHGFTLVGWLQQDPRLAGSVILMLSATDRQNYPDQCREVKTACLEKPVSRSALFNAIAKAIGADGAVSLVDAGKAAGVSPVPSRILRVLVAEDTPANQKLVLHVLGNRGHNVAIAENGRQALELVQQQDFDVALMDVQMPELDGFQATEAIRKLDDPKKARLPIIAMTAHALKGDQERCLAAGMDGDISKPIKREELLEMVERMGEGLGS